MFSPLFFASVLQHQRIFFLVLLYLDEHSVPSKISLQLTKGDTYHGEKGSVIFFMIKKKIRMKTGNDVTPFLYVFFKIKIWWYSLQKSAGCEGAQGAPRGEWRTEGEGGEVSDSLPLPSRVLIGRGLATESTLVYSEPEILTKCWLFFFAAAKIVVPNCEKSAQTYENGETEVKHVKKVLPCSISYSLK